MQKLKVLFARHGSKVATGSALLVGSASASAADVTAQITAISAIAETNQAAVIAAVISLAAISFGVGMIVRWLK